MNEPSIEIIDLAAEMQDRVVDAQWLWIDGLPVSNEIKEDIFKHLCVVTGILLDATIYPDKFDKLMSPDQ